MKFELGQVASGIIRTFRFFRGSEVICNKKQKILVATNRKGGLCFLFEINYNRGVLSFTAEVTQEADVFDKQRSKDVCILRSQFDAGKTFEIPYNPEEQLLDQVFHALETANAQQELGDKPFLRTLLQSLRLIDKQNAETAAFYQDLLDEGVIVEVDLVPPSGLKAA